MTWALVSRQEIQKGKEEEKIPVENGTGSSDL